MSRRGLEAPAWSPNGQEIALAATIHVPPAWSPDGKWIAYARQKAIGHAIWIMRADGSYRRRLTNAPASRDSTPSWRPTR